MFEALLCKAVFIPGDTVPLINSWTRLTDGPISSEAPFVAVDGKLYSIGGFTGAASAANNCYDIATDTWNVLAPLPVARRLCAVAAIGNKIYVYGGMLAAGTSTGVMTCYDIATNTWTTYNVGTARFYHNMVAIGDKLYSYGGSTSNTQGAQWGGLSCFDPGTNGWSTKLSLTKRMGHAAAVINDKMYIYGGKRDVLSGSWTTEYAREIVMYDPVTNTWGTPIPIAADTNHTSMVAIGDYLFAIGGQVASNSYSQALLRYRPTSNKWVTLTSSPLAVQRPGLAVWENKIYMYGGAGPGGNSPRIYRYEQ